MPWLSDQMCSAIINAGGRRSLGSVAHKASHASRNTAKARSPASRSSGYSATDSPDFEHGGEQRRLLARETEIGLADALESGARGGLAAVPGRAQRLGEAFEAAPRDVGHQRVAVAEMAVRRGGADAGSARGVREGEACRPLLGDEIERRRDERLAQIAVMIAAPAPGPPLCQVIDSPLAQFAGRAQHSCSGLRRVGEPRIQGCWCAQNQKNTVFCNPFQAATLHAGTSFLIAARGNSLRPLLAATVPSAADSVTIPLMPGTGDDTFPNRFMVNIGGAQTDAQIIFDTGSTGLFIDQAHIGPNYTDLNVPSHSPTRTERYLGHARQHDRELRRRGRQTDDQRGQRRHDHEPVVRAKQAQLPRA